MTRKYDALHMSKKDDMISNNWLESSIEVGRNLVATATMAAVLFGSPEAILSPSDFLTPPNARAESVLTEGSAPTAKLEGTALDEAWTLVNKYFIDRSFGGQVRTVV